MARKPRVELEGPLYHIITGGNDCRDIFHSAEDFQKFLSLPGLQKEASVLYLRLLFDDKSRPSAA
jgi:hypothetical protein